LEHNIFIDAFLANSWILTVDCLLYVPPAAVWKANILCAQCSPIDVVHMILTETSRIKDQQCYGDIKNNRCSNFVVTYWFHISKRTFSLPRHHVVGLALLSPALRNWFAFRWSLSLPLLLGRPISIFLRGRYCSASFGRQLLSILFTCLKQFFVGSFWSHLLYCPV
jgi:hypothetical protein